ncbi:MAG TPA: Uma2 family endonuclease [Gemmataceae bacterium]|jgi:Uma2 family endonuclease|nr:Uma2 family endonuclease [Gemmataceae bacterium]
MATVQQAPADQRFLLFNVSWKTYETFLAELGDRPIRLTYDRGNLELMAPSHVHERYKKILGRIIDTLTLELNILMKSGGSTTFKRKDLERGMEPDECYYIENEPLVRGKMEIDLTTDPPPDICIEIDITSSSLDRQGIYAAMRVPEIWRFDGESLRVYRLDANGDYQLCDRSPTFPFLPLDEIARFLQQANVADETSLIRAFITWLREEIVPRLQDGRARDNPGPSANS